VIRRLRQLWAPDGKLREKKAVSPTQLCPALHAPSSNCKQNGAFDPRTMGSVPNVGSDGPAAEEYGLPRQDVPDAGPPSPCGVVDAQGKTLIEHAVEEATSGAPAREGCADPRLGEDRRHPGPDHREARGLLDR